MEGEGIITAPAAAAITAVVSFPPHDPDVVSPVGSPDAPVDLQVPSPPSDDDHSSDTVVLTDDLRDKIIKQVEFYFSDENLPTDNYMMGFVKKNKEGFVPIGVIASFRKMKRLIRDKLVIAAALRESSLLVVSSDCKRVKRLHPLPVSEVKDPKLCTVLVENLPEDHSIDNIRRIFQKAGKIKNICIHDPHAVEESTKGSKTEKFISGKLHALVEYDCMEAAEKAVTKLNNEDDWRNGLRVKLLKHMVKYGQKKKVWRESDLEKNNDIRGSEQAGDENHNLSEHHNETPDEEDGEHVAKEKIGHKGRRQGRSRGQKYYGTNGQGHGATSSTHVFEAPKPPPGPKMPDGTRGFAMGRGRPPNLNQN